MSIGFIDKNWKRKEITVTDVTEATINDTVEAPMKIEPKENTYQQSYSGANIMKFTERTTSPSGTDYVCDSNGIATLTGTSTAASDIAYNQSADAMTLNAGNYTIKMIGTGIDDLSLIRTDTSATITLDSNKESTINITEDNTSFRILVHKKNGVTYNATYRITLASGNTATTEPYVRRNNKS